MKRMLSIILVLAVLLGVFWTAQAAIPGGPYSSAFYIQNLHATDPAGCSYIFYDSLGQLAYQSPNFNIPVGDNVEVYVPNLQVGAGNYSVGVYCSVEVAAISNFSDSNSGASYRSISNPTDTWYAPAIYDDFYRYFTNVVVQNAEGYDPVNITVAIYAPGSSVPVKTQTANNVPAGAAREFGQQGLAELNPNVSYSAKITATGNIAPVVTIYGKVGTTVEPQLYSYNPLSAGALIQYAPLIMNNYWGYNTALTIQNIGTARARVKVTYSNGRIDNYNIEQNSAKDIYSPSVLPGGNTLYNAKIESIVDAGQGVPTAQPIVAFVNQSNNTNRASSYTTFPSGATTVNLPVVYKLFYRYNTSVTCQNVGAGPTTMTITYKGPGVGSPTTSPSRAVGQSWEFYQPNDPSLASVALNWKGSAKVTASQPIVCVVNENQNLSPELYQNKDVLFTYEGVFPTP